MRSRACAAPSSAARTSAARRLGAGSLVAALALGIGCASRPVIYPMGGGTAQVDRVRLDQDIDDCTALARQHSREGSAMARDAARSTAVGGAIGAATGAVGGAIWGSAGRGAATGAAVGATSGLLGSLFRRAPGEDPVERRFVERCLTERGYDVIGWR
jgi:hypothetical protein